MAPRPGWGAIAVHFDARRPSHAQAQRATEARLALMLDRAAQVIEFRYIAIALTEQLVRLRAAVSLGRRSRSSFQVVQAVRCGFSLLGCCHADKRARMQVESEREQMDDEQSRPEPRAQSLKRGFWHFLPLFRALRLRFLR